MNDKMETVIVGTPEGPKAEVVAPAAVVVDFTAVLNPPANAENKAIEDAHDAAQASGQTKLMNLGLTQKEIFAMFGVEAAAVKAARKKERRGAQASGSKESK